jgi:large subunit ribosomal protein L33
MATKKNTKRKLIGLVSNLSGHRTYYTTRNTQNAAIGDSANIVDNKLQLSKYDPIARRHAVYTETKKNLGRNEIKPRKG